MKNEVPLGREDALSQMHSTKWLQVQSARFLPYSKVLTILVTDPPCDNESRPEQ